MKAYQKEWLEEEIENKLNKKFGIIEICGLPYPSGSVLREISPTMFAKFVINLPTLWVCSECQLEYQIESDAECCCQAECFECGKLFNNHLNSEICCSENIDKKEA